MLCFGDAWMTSGEGWSNFGNNIFVFVTAYFSHHKRPSLKRKSHLREDKLCFANSCCYCTGSKLRSQSFIRKSCMDVINPPWGSDFFSACADVGCNIAVWSLSWLADASITECLDEMNSSADGHEVTPLCRCWRVGNAYNPNTHHYFCTLPPQSCNQSNVYLTAWQMVNSHRAAHTLAGFSSECLLMKSEFL